MRSVSVFVLVLCALLVDIGGGRGAPRAPAAAPAASARLVQQAKIVCGQTDQGFKCRNESGAVRRGKMQKIPGASGGPSGGWSDSGGAGGDALPPATGEPGTGPPAPGAVPASCPANSELLGGHCIAYTQTCSKGLAGNAAPQACQGPEEKLVCDFRPDGLKDCCCRTYSKY